METRKAWVSKSDWPDYVDIPGTVEYTAKLYPRVLEAQEINLREAIGWDFYRVLAAVLENAGVVSGATVDGDAVNLTQAAYDAIVPYLKPIVIHEAYARHLEVFGIEETRYGQRVKQNPHSEQPSDKKIDRVLHRHRGMATHYMKALRKYLEDNASLYPDWEGAISSDSVQGTPRVSSIWNDKEPFDYQKKWYGWPYGNK